jgi:insulysin
LNQHGGMSNAYTSMENTNYYFDVQQEHFPGALDRFAQFFIKPLFTKDATDRELNAIESENSKNLQHDMWRSFQLEKSLSSPERAFMTAATFSLHSLWSDPRLRCASATISSPCRPVPQVRDREQRDSSG